ncbi:MAG: hypothetical protein V4521_02185 [Pseudomonadota bacterium]
MNNMMPFKQYLAGACFDHPFARDFAADALADNTFGDFTRWRELSGYLSQCRACRAAIIGAIIGLRPGSFITYLRRGRPRPALSGSRS